VVRCWKESHFTGGQIHSSVSKRWERNLPADWMTISGEARGEDASFCGVCRIVPYHHFVLTYD